MEEQRSQLQALGELARLLSELGEFDSLPPGAQLQALTAVIHPSDLADLLLAAPEHARLALIASLPDDDDAAEVLALLDEGTREDLLVELPLSRKAALVKELAHDDAADVLSDLPEGEQDQVLAELDAEEAAELRELAAHPPDSAGGLMNDEFVAVQDDQTVRAALMQVKTSDQDWEDITEVLVVDDHGRLKGVADLDDLLRARLDQSLRDVMESKPVFAGVDEDREDVARRAAHYRLSLLPVVDTEERLVGVIAYDDVMEALGDEASEDMYRLAGTLEQHPARESLLERLAARLPFLLVTIVGTYLVALLIRVVLGEEHVPAILRFIPMIAALAGNAGIQASTTMIRGFATGEVQARHFGWMMRREASLGVLTGISAALVELPLLFLCREPTQMLIVVPAAQALAVILATANGTAIPFLCWRTRISIAGREISMDPALAAGPFITTLNDIVSTAIALALSLYLVLP